MKEYKLKFNIGESVWTMLNNKAVQKVIIGIKVVEGKKLSEDLKATFKIQYNLTNPVVGQELTKEEFELFTTKELLLRSL